MEKGVDLLGRGREAGEIERQSANERDAIGARLGREVFLAEPAVDEGVDGMR